MSLHDGMIIGLIYGILVTLTVILLDKLKIDNLIGTIPVHLICGMWGTLDIGLFGSKNQWTTTHHTSRRYFGHQHFVFTKLSLLIFLLLKVNISIHVSEKEEL
ncbi:MAG: hypothetical protein ABI045_03845 [Flavobacteriales bacterium]